MLEAQIVIPLPDTVREQLQFNKFQQEDIEADARLALARALYARGDLTVGLAAQLAGLERGAFMARLAESGDAIVCLPEEELKKEFDKIESMLGDKKTT
jgi:predicted HTH domain antitoxin